MNDLLQAVRLFASVGGVIEIRALNCQDNNPEYTHTRIGYFDPEHLPDAVAAIQELESTWKPSGIYVTLNPVILDVRGRSANRIRKAQRGESTKDAEILRRRWLLIDFDPTRPAGVSSTDAELAAAESLCRAVGIWLCDHGFPVPVVAMSGNGFHLLFMIDLPPNDGGLVERCLKALDQAFSTAAVSVDTAVHNPARITKCYGTLTRKGDHTDDRPHRRSKLIEVPADLQIVPAERLEWLAAQFVEPAKPATNGYHTSTGGIIDVEQYLSRHGVPVLARETGRDGTNRWFITCPGEASHTTRNNPRDCCVTQEPSGRLGGKCFHASCGMGNWQSLKGAIGPVESADFPDSTRGHSAPKTANSEIDCRHNPTKPSEKQFCQRVNRFVGYVSNVFPGPVKDFIVANARAMDCDESYLGGAVLAVLAGAVGNTRRIRLKSSWYEPAIVWTVIVGNSGSRKSPPIDAAAKPLRDRQARALRDHAKLMEGFERDQAEFAAASRRYKGQGQPPERPAEPVADRYLVSDLTIEALAYLLNNQPRGLLVVRDELDGWLGGFDQYKSGKGSDLANWLELHGGRSLTVDRRTGSQRTLYVPRAAVSLTGGIQPGILTSKITTAHVASGLFARLLFTFAPSRPRKWTEAEVDEQVVRNYAQVVENLLSLKFVSDNLTGDSVPGLVSLSSDAKRRFAEFVNEHGQETADLDDSLTASFAKLEGYAARFGLILHLTRWACGESVDPDVCDLQSIENGIKLSRWYANEARRIHALLSETVNETEIRQLIDWIQRKGGSVSPRELYRKNRRYPTASDSELTLQTLVDMGEGIWTPVPSTDAGGRPSRIFSLSCRHADTTVFQAENEGSVSVEVPSLDSDFSELDFDEVNRLFGGRPA